MQQPIADPRPRCREKAGCDKPAELVVDGVVLCGPHALAAYYAKATAGARA